MDKIWKLKAVRAGLIILAAAVILSGIAAGKRLVNHYKDNGETGASAASSDFTGTGGPTLLTMPDAAALASMLANPSGTAASDSAATTAVLTSTSTSASSESAAVVTTRGTTETTGMNVNVNTSDFPASVSGDFKYSVTDGLAAIDSYLGNGGAVNVPAKIGGVPVYAISPGAFAGTGGTAGQKITSVTIAPGVVKIGSTAFSACTALKSVTIPGSVTEIGDYAFESCPNVVIKCSAGSVACAYAIEHNISYVN